MLVRLRDQEKLFFDGGQSAPVDEYLIVSGRDFVDEAVVIRCIFLPDRSQEQRRNLVEGMFPGLDHRRFDHDDSTLFSSSREEFDILLFHGDDERRMAKAIRDYAPLLRSKPKIAFLTKSTPQSRAILLNAGFDDVFDQRADAEEVQCRVGAIMRRIRYREAMELRESGDIYWEMVNRYSRVRPTKREAEIFSELFGRLGERVPFEHLAYSRVTRNKSRSKRALSVTISKLRSKLSPQIEIVSSYDGGYVMKMKTDK